MLSTVEVTSMDDTAQRVKSIIARYLDIPVKKVTDNADLREDLGADSLEVVEIVIAFEEEFDLEIEDDKINGISTVNDIVKLLQRAVA